MPHERDAELSDWAAARAPELIARAEAEAVAMLRDALVSAALGSREAPAPAPAPRPPEIVHSDETGELWWAYCVLDAGAPVPPRARGVDPDFPVESIEVPGLVALVSRVPRAEFGADALRQNLNELEWLERVARAHEDVLESTLDRATLVPLRLCTLYESEDAVRRMLEQQRAGLTAALAALAGREEWGIKLLVDPRRLAAEVQETDAEAHAMAEEVEGQSEGGAYMLRRRLERHLREGADALATSLAADLRGRLEVSGTDFVTQPPQNRELSQHEGEMLLNAACLVDAPELERLRGLVSEFESRYEHLGARVEITGPWPPYNFVIGGDAATLA